jgi:hypothetical protein
LQLYTSIPSSLIRKKLFTGLAFAGAGVLLLTYSGSFVTPDTLSVWGLPILGLSLFLITYGLLPYRRLTYLEIHPNTLSIEDEEFLQYRKEGEPLFSIPLDKIEALGYFERGEEYGITVKLKQTSEKKVLVHARNFSAEEFQKYSQKKTGADLFFPFFSRRSYVRLGGLPHKRMPVNNV